MISSGPSPLQVWACELRFKVGVAAPLMQNINRVLPLRGWRLSFLLEYLAFPARARIVLVALRDFRLTVWRFKLAWL